VGNLCFGRNNMLVGNEKNNLKKRAENIRVLAYCAFLNICLRLANLGQSLFFPLLLLVCQQA
jgi:hypothetical protein